jgi:hypothetical protein
MIPTHNSIYLCNEAIQQCIEWPGNRVGLFRWENKSFLSTTYMTLMEWLPEALVDSHDHSKQTIRFKNGSQISYGGIKSASSVSSGDPMARLKSLELGCCGIDEVTEVPESYYNLLSTRTGRVWVTDPATGQRVRPPNKVFATCNPEPGWCKLKFVDQRLPDHAFIPSRLTDNPFLSDTYRNNLIANLPADWVDRYVNGNWDMLSPVNGLFPPAWKTAATQRNIQPSQPVVFGIDVATWGHDKTVVVRRRGYVLDILYIAPPQGTMATVRQICQLYETYKPNVMRVDGVGVGAGVFDRLDEIGMPVENFSGGMAAQDPRRFANIRSEWHWGMRTLLERGLIRLPSSPELTNEMGSLQYLIAMDRKIQIESKESMRKRGVKSPNLSDACVYAAGDLGLNYSMGGVIK